MAETRKDLAAAPARAAHDPFALLRQVATELDRAFGEPVFGASRWPLLRAKFPETTWAPKIDVFEQDNRLVTRVDLPGVKKENVTVEVTDGHLALTGERIHEAEEKKNNFYRNEREYGTFYRVVPLPEGVKVEEIIANFADGVLEVIVPLPARADAKPKKIEIGEGVKKEGKAAA